MDDFDSIYSEYYSLVYHYTLSLCRNQEMAEEVTQEAFFKALKHIGSFRGESKLSVWLCQIAKHTLLSMQAKQSKHQQQTEPVPSADASGLEQILIDRETARSIHRILHRLAEPYKEVFSLRVFGELPFAQIAELFGKTESWARVTYHRAKLKIREELL